MNKHKHIEIMYFTKFGITCLFSFFSKQIVSKRPERHVVYVSSLPILERTVFWRHTLMFCGRITGSFGTNKILLHLFSYLLKDI
jgi:hypothetical protein